MLAISGLQIGGFVVGIICAIACAMIADRKGRSALLWGILGFFFSIIPLIIILVLKPTQDA